MRNLLSHNAGKFHFSRNIKWGCYDKILMSDPPCEIFVSVGKLSLIALIFPEKPFYPKNFQEAPNVSPPLNCIYDGLLFPAQSLIIEVIQLWMVTLF